MRKLGFEVQGSPGKDNDERLAYARTHLRGKTANRCKKYHKRHTRPFTYQGCGMSKPPARRRIRTWRAALRAEHRWEINELKAFFVPFAKSKEGRVFVLAGLTKRFFCPSQPHMDETDSVLPTTWVWASQEIAEIGKYCETAVPCMAH